MLGKPWSLRFEYRSSAQVAGSANRGTPSIKRQGLASLVVLDSSHVGRWSRKRVLARRESVFDFYCKGGRKEREREALVFFSNHVPRSRTSDHRTEQVVNRGLMSHIMDS